MIDLKQRRLEYMRVRRQRFAQLLEITDGYCHYCKRPFDDPEYPQASKPTIDHIVPVILGGNDELVNLVLACAYCNSGKKDMSYEQFVKRIEGLKTLEFFGASYRRWSEEYERRQFTQSISSRYRELDFDDE